MNLFWANRLTHQSAHTIIKQPAGPAKSFVCYFCAKRRKKTMKSIAVVAASTIIILLSYHSLIVGAAPYGLLRIDDGPLATSSTSSRNYYSRDVTTKYNRRHELMTEEDSNLYVLKTSETIGLTLMNIFFCSTGIYL
jgi:hypothetical protein